ncbi:MAG: propionyl-CoA synthetase, partial [Rhodospirillales bacterium]|nr:propionyl-CoA synthetase [Rhodospirillales bacterium]
MTKRYDQEHARSLADPEGYWGEAAGDLHWTKQWDKVLDASKAPFYRWFAGAETNTCHNALDRHVEGGRADQLALIYDSPVTNKKATYTYRQLRD